MQESLGALREMDHVKTGHVFEVLCEVRFTGSPALPAGVILPGTLFNQLLADQLVEKFEALPQASIPLAIRENDENLRYLATHRMSGVDGFIVAVGDHVLATSITDDYRGWADLRTKASKVFKHAMASGTLGTLERVSVKYLNLFPAKPTDDQLALINASMRIGKRTLSSESMQLRYDFKQDDIEAIIQIVTQANVQAQVGTFHGSGLVLDMDFIVIRPHDSLEEVLDSLDRAHARAIEVYQDVTADK